MKSNRGLSFVESFITIVLVIVVMIFAMPVFVRHINNVKFSRDMELAKEISDAIVYAIKKDSIKENAVDHVSPYPVESMEGNEFKECVMEELANITIKGKTKKDVDGELLEGGTPQFYYTLNVAKNKVEIYYGGTDVEYQIYPSVGKKLLDE